MSPIQPMLQAVKQRFDDFDAMAAAALQWNQEYEQIGHGRFSGELNQLLLSQMQFGRLRWSPGILQKGAAPRNCWVFGVPIRAEGSLHVRRRPVQNGELLVATSHDDIGFAATGPTDMMVVVLPNGVIRRWMNARRGDDGIDPDLPPRHWTVTSAEMARRSKMLSILLDELMNRSDADVTPGLIARVESRISDAILDLIPSAERVESQNNRARIARAVLRLLHDRRDDPPSVTEMCQLIGVRERTLFLSCVEAFGRPPAHLLLELRLNAVRRVLLRPKADTSVTAAASNYGFTHFGRFASMYLQRFDERPSATLAKSLGSR